MIVDIYKGFVQMLLGLIMVPFAFIMSFFVWGEWVRHDKFFNQYKNPFHTYYKNMIRIYFTTWGDY